MDIFTYIWEDALILVPALLVLGQVLKNIAVIPDKFIPLILLVAGIPAGMALAGWTMEGAIQGVLVTGAAVFGNQIWKQLNKSE